MTYKGGDGALIGDGKATDSDLNLREEKKGTPGEQ